MAKKKPAYRPATLDDLIAGGLRYDDTLASQPAPEEAAPQERGMLRTAADYGISALKGAIAVPEAVVGLADIPTGGRVGRALEGVGFRPREAKEFLNEQYSQQQKDAFRAVQDAEGFGGTLAAAVQNPSVIAHSVTESLPAMGAGGVVGRGLMAAVPRIGAVGAAAAGEGVVGAGGAAEQIRQQTTDGLMTPQQSGLALATGGATAAFGALGAKIAKSLGIGDVDTMLVGAATNPATAKGVVRRVLEGAASEGILEELPQSVSEQVLQNVALGRDVTEGVDQAAVLGMLSGAAMGGAVNVMARGPAAPPPVFPGADAAPEPPPAAPAGPLARAASTIAPQPVDSAPAEPGPAGDVPPSDRFTPDEVRAFNNAYRRDVPDPLGELQGQVKASTAYTTPDDVQAVGSQVENAWLRENVAEAPTAAVEPTEQPAPAPAAPLETEPAGDPVGQVDANVRESRILSGLQNILDAGPLNTMATVRQLNQALGRIGEKPLTQDERARVKRAMDAQAGFTGKTEPAPLPELQPAPVDETAQNDAMEALIPERKPKPEQQPAPAGPQVFPTYEEADSFRREQRRRGASITALPVATEGGFTLATSGTPKYEQGVALRTERRAAKERADAGILDGDILNRLGKPFTVRLPAINAAKKAGADHQVVPVTGGFVVRKGAADGAADAVQPGPDASDRAGRADAAGGMAPALGRADPAGPAATTGALPAAAPAEPGDVGRGTGDAEAVDPRLEAALADDFERAYQRDIKDAIKQRRGMAPAPKQERTKQSPLRALLREHGIDPKLAADITGDRGMRANQRMPGTFRRGGKQLDELATLARERGFLTDADMENDEDTGGTRRLVEMIQAELRGERQVATEFADEVASDAMASRAADDLQRQADAIGFDTRGLDDAQLADSLRRIERRRQQAQARREAFDIKAEVAGERLAIQGADVGLPDDVLDGLVGEGNNATVEDAMRALGFTDQEIQDATADQAQGARQGRQGGGRPDEVAAGPAQGGRGANQGIEGQEGLTSPTRADIEAGQDRAAQAARTEAATQRDNEQRARADAERGEFTLTGSDRAADVAAAGGQQAMFSRAPTKQATAHRVAAVQHTADELTAAWANAPRVVVAQNIDDPKVPQAIRSERDKRESKEGGEVRAVFHNGTVYLLADQLPTDASAAIALFHEALGHAGLRGAFGDALTPILRDIARLRRADIAEKAREYGLDLTNEQDRLTAAEEVLAEWAQRRPEIGWVRRAVAAIRQWLRQNMPGLAKMRMTDDEIVGNFLMPARGWVERGRAEATGRPVPAFSRGKTPSVANSKDVAGNQGGRPAGDTTEGASRPYLVDEKGRPLVLHHGTAADFESFDLDSDARDVGGIWFSDSHNYAYDMAGGGWNIPPSRRRKGRVISARIQSANPKTIDVIEEGKRVADEIGVDAPQDAAEAQELLSGTMSWDRVVSDMVSDAKREGHDALVIRNFDDGRVVTSTAYVIFSPDQIEQIANETPASKSGDAPMFSRSAALNDPRQFRQKASQALTDLTRGTGNTLADYRGLALSALGRRQIAEIYGKDLPQLAPYSELTQQMDADKNDAGAGADRIATAWGKLADERALAVLMHDATLAQIDPAKPQAPGDDAARYQALRRDYDALTPDAKQVYADARDTYRRHHEAVRTALRERIERSEIRGPRKAALLKQMDDEFFKAIKGVYFPLARFGDYVVVVRDSNGTAINVSRAETMNEAQALQVTLRRAYPTAAVGKVLKSKEFNAGRDAVGRGFMQELYKVLGKKEMDDRQRGELEDMLGQLYLSALPDLSWAKHGIHRKGTPGYSQNARRAFAQNVFHGARYLAKVRYSDLLEDELSAMQKHVDGMAGVERYDSVKAQQVVDEMVKRHDAMMNPDASALSTALTSLGFVFHLGLSPASAMVNLTQTAFVALPIMGAKWGFTKASAALLRASKETAAHKNDITSSLSADERRAYDQAVRAGVIDVTMAHDLAGISQGEDAKVSWKLRPVMKWASFLFHHAEKFNRQVTFVAAYRLAREDGAGHEQAHRDAVKATYDGHFDYSAGNRPRLMQGNVARVVLLFKQYAQNMIYTLARQGYLAVKAEQPSERAEARKALGGLLAMHAAGAGVLGLPLVTTLLAAASMVGGSDDEPWDAESALRNMLADAIGQKPAEVLARGLSRLTPFDISGRVGLDKLILPDVQEGLEGQRLGESAMAAALGPVAGIGISLLKGLQEMSDGNWMRGLESMAPSVVRGPLKALRYADEGVVDRTGKAVLSDVDGLGIFGQAMGFSPSDVRLAYEGKSAIYEADQRLVRRRAELMRKYSMARLAQDDEAAQEAQTEISGFNSANPARRITPLHLGASVRLRRRQIAEAEQGVYLPTSRRDAIGEGRFAVAAE